MKCPNCDSPKISLFHDKVWSMNNGSVYKCKKCDLVFINPIMNDDEEVNFYKNFNEHVKERGVTKNKSLKEYHEKSLIIAKERFEIIGKYFSNALNILEIDSSTGSFLSLLKNSTCSAVEISDENRTFSEQFINGHTYSNIKDVPQKNQFDIICLFHVFEYIKNPKEFLEICSNLLSNKGLLLIEVPNINDPLISVYNIKEFKDFVFQPMHPMVYSKESLDYIFSTCNYENKETIYFQRYGLDNHLSWLKNKKSGGDEYLNILFKDNLEYKKTLEKSKNTDTIFYIANKKRVI